MKFFTRLRCFLELFPVRSSVDLTILLDIVCVADWRKHLPIYWLVVLTVDQAFSQDLKSGHPKCDIRPAQTNNFKGNIWKIKQFSSKCGRPQEAWTPIWLKACSGSLFLAISRNIILTGLMECQTRKKNSLIWGFYKIHFCQFKIKLCQTTPFLTPKIYALLNLTYVLQSTINAEKQIVQKILRCVIKFKDSTKRICISITY